MSCGRRRSASFGPNADRGVFKSTDGGKTWKKTLFVDPEHGARVLALNMSNPNELYAGMYRGFRKGWDIISGGPATKGGIYKSTDGGETWTKLSTGLPQPLIGKIDIDIARSQPNIVYAMIEAPGDQGGLYRSDDSGATWRIVNSAGNLRSRPFYFNYVDVNPKNPDEVWVNALDVQVRQRRQDVHTVGTPHGDNHGIWFNPDDPMTAIQCNDGGANVTRDGGRTWSSILNQATGEFYMVSVDQQYPYLLYGPQQDNSTIVVRASHRLLRLRPPGAGVDAGLRLRDRRHRADARREGDLGARARERSSASASRRGSRRAAGSIRRTVTATIRRTSSTAFRGRR